ARRPGPRPRRDARCSRPPPTTQEERKDTMNAAIAETTLRAKELSMSDIRIVRDYPHPPAKVWRALTDPALMALWGMRPEGFAPVAGTRFKLVAKPERGWRGFVECEVLEASEPSILRCSWLGDDDPKKKTQ